MSDGSHNLLYAPDGPYRFEMPLTFAACRAVTLGDATNGSCPRKIATKLHASRGHASAQRLKRAPVDSDGNNMHLPTCVDEVLTQCDVCQAFEKAPDAPVARTSTVAASNANLRVGILVSGDIITLHVLGVLPKNSPGGLGCLLGFADWSFRPSVLHPDE